MKFNFKIPTLMMSLCLISAMAFAQDAPRPTTVSGVIFANYAMHFGDDRPDNDLRKHGFDIERVYLNFRRPIGEKWSIRVTTDFYQRAADERGELYIKYALAEYRDKFGEDFTTRVNVGVIAHPINNYLNGLGDMRWLTRNMIRQQGLFGSADLGVSAQLNYQKLAMINLSVLNGEIYSNAIEQSFEHYKGKQANLLAALTPIENLNIFGFGSYEKYFQGREAMFFGGGLGWTDKFIKAGVSSAYVLETRPWARHTGIDGTVLPSADRFGPNDVNGRTRGANFGEGLYLDSWVNVNFQDIIGMPITFNGRVSYVMPANDNINGDTDNVITVAFGPGYKFNDNVQFALWTTMIKYGDKLRGTELTNSIDEMTVQLKTEIRW